MFVENYSLKYGMAMKKFSETHSLGDNIYLKVDSKNIKNKNTFLILSYNGFFGIFYKPLFLISLRDTFSLLIMTNFY